MLCDLWEKLLNKDLNFVFHVKFREQNILKIINVSCEFSTTIMHHLIKLSLCNSFWRKMQRMSLTKHRIHPYSFFPVPEAKLTTSKKVVWVNWSILENLLRELQAVHQSFYEKCMEDWNKFWWINKFYLILFIDSGYFLRRPHVSQLMNIVSRTTLISRKCSLRETDFFSN